MKKTKWTAMIVSGALFLALGVASGAKAETVLANGSFETGDYTGWVILQGEGSLSTDGTWGIAQEGQIINRSDNVFDFFDQILVSQRSSGLPITYHASEGSYLALQLQNGGQDHRLFQDVSLPENAATLSWDMFYTNHDRLFSPDQYLAVHVRDLNDNILETLYVTDEASPLSMPMGNLIYDISAYAGTKVRIDVEMKVHRHFFDAAFDNFTVGLAAEDESPSELAPPGWSRSKGKKFGWAEQKPNNIPNGFGQGKKNGWEK